MTSHTHPPTNDDIEELYAPYQAVVMKHLNHGIVAIVGRAAGNRAEAKENLQKAEVEYETSGGWGGPG